MFFRTLFLLFFLGFWGQGSLGLPREDEAGTSSSARNPVTPAARAPAPSADKTPGQLLSRKQAQVLQQGNFEAIINAALGKPQNDQEGRDVVASWGISWGIFQDLSSPHTSTKLEALRRLGLAMKQCYAQFQGNDDFQDLYDKVFGIKARIETVHLERLENSTRNYFERLFPNTKVAFRIKPSGVQLGTIVTVIELSGKIHKFYVKTHSEGKLRTKSSGAKTIDPRELLIYKILEKLKLAPEVHFMARSPEDVYIATRDAGEDGQFFLFQQATEGDQRFGESLWGSLGTIKDSVRENDWEDIERRLLTDPIAQNFVQQIATLDILSRLFRLHDFLNNTENFGFSRDLDGFYRVRVLDFRLHDNIVEFDESYFRSFLAGNGLFNYAAAHNTLGFILRNRTQAKRVEAALHTFQHGNLRNFKKALNDAHREVVRYIEETKEFSAYQKKFLDDLASYISLVENGRKCFKKCLKHYRGQSAQNPVTPEG